MSKSFPINWWITPWCIQSKSGDAKGCLLCVLFVFSEAVLYATLAPKGMPNWWKIPYGWKRTCTVCCRDRRVVPYLQHSVAVCDQLQCYVAVCDQFQSSVAVCDHIQRSVAVCDHLFMWSSDEVLLEGLVVLDVWHSFVNIKPFVRSLHPPVASTCRIQRLYSTAVFNGCIRRLYSMVADRNHQSG